MIQVVHLDSGARHEGRTIQNIVPMLIVVPHDGTQTMNTDPRDRSSLAAAQAAQLQHDGLHKPAGLWRLCRSRPVAQDDAAHRERDRERKRLLVHVTGEIKITEP